MARVLSVKPGAKRWGWLLSRERDAAGVVLALIDEAMRKDVVARALNDEYVADVLVRERVARLRPRVPGADEHDRLVRAERQILARLARGSDPRMRAAAVRLRLWRRIERREFPPGQRQAARDRLQELREARPGGWK